MFISVRPYGQQPARLFCPWDSPGKNTRVSCCVLLQGIFPTQGSNLHLLHWQMDSLPLNHLGNPRFYHACVHAKWLQSYPILCKPMHCNLPGSSVHGILQARILEWVAMPSCRGSCWPNERTCVSYVFCIAGRRFTIWATREVLYPLNVHNYIYQGLPW